MKSVRRSASLVTYLVWFGVAACADRVHHGGSPKAIGQAWAPPDASSPVDLRPDASTNDSVLADAGTDAVGATMHSQPCDGFGYLPPGTEDEAASYLFKDPDYRRFVCSASAQRACSKKSFREGLEYRCEFLNERLPLIGVFVEPKQKATNIYTGFFILQRGKLVPQTTFFGSGIGSDNQKVRGDGFKVVLGAWRGGPSSSIEYYFEWNGQRYVEVREQEFEEQ